MVTPYPGMLFSILEVDAVSGATMSSEGKHGHTYSVEELENVLGHKGTL